MAVDATEVVAMVGVGGMLCMMMHEPRGGANRQLGRLATLATSWRTLWHDRRRLVTQSISTTQPCPPVTLTPCTQCTSTPIACPTMHLLPQTHTTKQRTRWLPVPRLTFQSLESRAVLVSVPIQGELCRNRGQRWGFVMRSSMQDACRMHTSRPTTTSARTCSALGVYTVEQRGATVGCTQTDAGCWVVVFHHPWAL